MSVSTSLFCASCGGGGSLVEYEGDLYCQPCLDRMYAAQNLVKETGHTLRPYQEEAVEAILDALKQQRSTLLVTATGCHDPRQRLLMADGSTKIIGDIRVGEKLLGMDGMPRTVLRRNEGTSQMVRVVPKKGTPFIVTDDHVLTLVRTNRTGKQPDAKSGMLVDVPISQWRAWPRFRKHIHKLLRVSVDFAGDPSPLPISPYVLGVLLGDGSFKKQLDITTPDEPVRVAVEKEVARFSLQLKDYGNTNCGKATNWRFVSGDKTHRLKDYRNKVLRPLGLDMVRCEDKFVPLCYKTSSRGDRMEMLAGLLDSDGHLTCGCYDFISKSKRLADDLAFIARSLGFAAYTKESEKHSQCGGGGMYWRVSVSGDVSIIPCRVKHKQASRRKQKKSVLRTGFSVEPIGVGRYVGLTVDGDNRYLLDDFTVTHNCGKTHEFVEVAARWPTGRVLILAHRDELIRQAARKVRKIIGESPDIEQAGMRADTRNLLSTTKVVVSSVQTMCRWNRHSRFDPNQFGLVVVDEAHHSTGNSYRTVLNWFQNNPSIKILGVTATPNRSDESALGQIYDSVAYDYGIVDGIQDGWLVPVCQEFVPITNLDYSGVSTSMGDLNHRELNEILEDEEIEQQFCSAVMDIVGDKQTLIFASSVAQAQKMSEILNRYNKGRAEWLCGNKRLFPLDERREILRRYARRDTQFLANMGVLTEGFDDPGTQVIVMARPTKSQLLYQQILGRGLRPLTGLVDGLADADARKAAIAASGKPDLLAIDFVGNSGRHKLVHTGDILGGNYDEDVVELAVDAIRQSKKPMDMLEALREAAVEKRRQEEERRKHIIGKAEYSRKRIDPFALWEIEPERERGWDRGKGPTPWQRERLVKLGVEPAGLDRAKARQLIAVANQRRTKGLCTYKQASLLAKFGFRHDVTFEAASEMIDKIAKSKWRMRGPLKGKYA